MEISCKGLEITLATKIPLIGQTSTGKSPFVDDQKTVNWYPEINPAARGGISLYPTPGYTTFSTIGLGVIRGAISFGDNLYVKPNGNRECRICKKAASIKSYHAIKKLTVKVAI